MELPYAGGCCINGRKHRSPEMNTNGETAAAKLHYRGGGGGKLATEASDAVSVFRREVFLRAQTTTCDDL